MGRASNREKYVSHLLTVCKKIVEQVYSEIDEVHHDKGRCSEEVKESLIRIIELKTGAQSPSSTK